MVTVKVAQPKRTVEQCEAEHHWVDWVDCWNSCDEGYITDLYEQDPLWYYPGDVEPCDICHGKGGWRVCRTCNPEVGDDE